MTADASASASGDESRRLEGEYQSPIGSRNRGRDEDEREGAPRFAYVAKPGAADWTKGRAQNAYAAEWLAVRLRRFRVLYPTAPVPDELAEIATETPEAAGLLQPLVAGIAGIVQNLTQRPPIEIIEATPGAAAASKTTAKAEDPIRAGHAAHVAPPKLPVPDYPVASLSGIALSGGGIRSATFCLGVLQALGERRLLHMFDFLSTVSGGGYVGGWWSAWLSRPRPVSALQRWLGSFASGMPGRFSPKEFVAQPGTNPHAPTLFPDDERLEPDRYQPLVLDPTTPVDTPVQVVPRPSAPDGSHSVALNDPINHLRLFSNYLTPRTGLLSADTWRVVTIVVRNLILTWLVLLPLLLAAVALGQLYFVADNVYVTPFVQPPTPLLSPPPRAGLSNPGGNKSAQGQAGASPVGAALTPVPDMRAIDSTVRESRERAFRVVRMARLTHALRPAAVLLIWFGALVIVWLLYNTGTAGSAIIGLLALGLMVALLVPGLNAAHWVRTAVSWLPWTPKMPPAPVTAPPAQTAAQSAGSQAWLTWGWVGALILGIGFGIVFPLVDLVRLNLRRLRAPNTDDISALAGAAGGRVATRAQADTSLGDANRNRLVRAQSALLVTALGVSLILVAAGFSHELVATLFGPGGTLPLAAAKLGGWGALLVAAASGLYTAVKAAPTVRGGAQSEQLGSVGSIMFAVAPVLVLASLTIGFGTLSHRLIADFGISWAGVRPLALAASVGLALVMMFAAMESYDERAAAPPPPPASPYSRFVGRRPGLGAAIPLTVSAVVWLVVLWEYRPVQVGTSPTPAVLGEWMACTIVLVGFRYFTRKGDHGSIFELGPRWTTAGNDSAIALVQAQPTGTGWLAHHPRIKRALVVWVFGLGALAVAWLFLGPALQRFAEHSMAAGSGPPDGQLIADFAFAILSLAAVMIIGELLLGFGDRKRSTGLATIGAVGASCLLLTYWLPTPAQSYATFAVALAVALVAGVIGLGWTIDPNLLSLHNLYKARLVRAYLGASNFLNRQSQEITEAAPDDDIPLCKLQNANRGAPIHLINTTLNLVGARDLTTAQRSAAPFVMSQLMCGSMRTGYRETSRYMGGKLTLGTAVATSGAAVSPNMGSRTQSAALSLLMGLLNIRLGLWAPTPDKRRWFEDQTRLWPLYLLRESLSQTNALGTFCYLTDGGHFDNTGMYSLVERACQYILVVDAGEDTTPCFADIGEAVRRCRIDFGAEINLAAGVAAFEKAKNQGLTLGHFVAGTVQYSDVHLRMLGYTPAQVTAAKRGTIIWVKPSIAKEDSVDLRQYRIEKEPFPHQTTADQWFDEAQFESYRALGYQSLSRVLASNLPPTGAPLTVLEVAELFKRLAESPAPPAAGPVAEPATLETALGAALQPAIQAAVAQATAPAAAPTVKGP